MRLFVAIPFSEGSRQALVGLQRSLMEGAVKGRFTSPENLHLTLAFLGECKPGQVAALESVLEGTAFGPFEIQIDRLGRFQRPGGDIWWAGLSESRPLFALQRNLAERLREAGFSLEQRKYSPHVTLGRQVVTEAAERKVAPFGERVTQIALMVSERIQGRPLVYRSIYEKEADLG